MNSAPMPATQETAVVPTWRSTRRAYRRRSRPSLMVDLCYVISHGFSARMILHSGIVPELAKRGLSLAVVTPNAAEAPMRRLAEDLGVDLYPMAKDHPMLASLLAQNIQRYVFEDVAHNAALRAKHERDIYSNVSRPWQRGLAHLMMAVNHAAMRFPQVPTTLELVRRRALRNVEVEEQLREINPQLVIATYAVNPLEAAYLLAAEQLGIAGVSHLLSWDNITCKGRFPVVPPYHIAWGPIMADELQQHYSVPEANIYQCGVPHFDAHVTCDPVSHGHPLSELGLATDRPYLFFGMSSPVFAPREIDLVEWLADRVRGGYFGPDMQLVVRPHPQNVQGKLADLTWIERLHALHEGPVAVDIPKLEASELRWNMKRSDLPRLASLIRGCAVCLNSGSTLSIDAIVHDRPVVMTPFDAGETGLPWWGSARRLPEYPHLAKLISLGGVRVVRSYAELESTIHRYLADPEADADGRRRTRERECGPCDGHASERVAQALADLRTQRAMPEVRV